MLKRTGVILGVLLLAMAALVGCSSNSSSTTSSKVDTRKGTVIDVRTPGEFASGHLEGATNIDIESGAFETEVRKLDPSKQYFVYCRSGNRSKTATAIMTNLGFTGVTDLGGIDTAAASTGLAVVQ